MSNRNRDPFDDPFFRNNDPFPSDMGSVFEHFDRLFDAMTGHGPHHRHDENPFDGFFGGFFGPFGPPRGRPRGPRGGGGGPRAEADVPDLSLINPEAPPPRQDERTVHSQNHNGDVWVDIRDLFGGTDVLKPDRTPRLGDINPDVYRDEHAPITPGGDNGPSNFGFPPGFRSPYLPNDEGEELDIPQSYFRSYSSVTYTNENGESETRMTVRDENGERTTVTRRGPDGESYDHDGGGSGFGSDFRGRPPSITNDPMINMGQGTPILPPPQIRRQNFDDSGPPPVAVHDPFGRWRAKARNAYWRYWPFAGIFKERRDDSRGWAHTRPTRPAQGTVEWRSADNRSAGAWLDKIRDNDN